MPKTLVLEVSWHNPTYTLESIWKKNRNSVTEKFVKMTCFETLNSQKSISRKILVARKFGNIHTKPPKCENC